MQYPYVSILIFMSLNLGACGVSKFKSVVDAGLSSANEGSSSSDQQPSIQKNAKENAQLDVKVVEEETRSDTIEETNSDNTADGLGVIGSDVWVVSWNTDDYIDADCLMLTKGIAVTEQDCVAKLETVCETTCQASAKTPQDCNQDKYVFQALENKFNYSDAQQACLDQGLVLLHYHISKVTDFKAQAGLQ